MTSEQPHYHGHRQRLRKRFLRSGLSGFADYEMVELLLIGAVDAPVTIDEASTALDECQRLKQKELPTGL
ncbi:hypothetical protein [Candidatus Chloroploca asiatica]|uniref:Uncharacterized protein n=1 Tax=Candidatus Chloroploca asiatica TaxID=1506545 RepID=A0A2H3L0P1_9CHLR|nr:hypothetical protein [Candidatus Chloroploca asiatica]PDV96707.1 hypothetical protein A9Q02_05630 [Candidatus Chloroploca asiatica]